MTAERSRAAGDCEEREQVAEIRETILSLTALAACLGPRSSGGDAATSPWVVSETLKEYRVLLVRAPIRTRLPPRLEELAERKIWRSQSEVASEPRFFGALECRLSPNQRTGSGTRPQLQSLQAEGICREKTQGPRISTSGYLVWRASFCTTTTTETSNDGPNKSQAI
ncbi:hypothetical protein NDU88_006250 [Pleurodeles waltl]|uniref:Uncharacterized protein n=1 Tax=Pleurodeles waltl TaxID=8319 RepID=A0AAV7VPB1_PLEWA|nr:hypothetical protein NDU88_006250 [Pleurodeles waltl]